MGCCLSKFSSSAVSSKLPTLGGRDAPFQKFVGSTPVGKLSKGSVEEGSGNEASPSSDTHAAEHHRFTAYYGDGSSKDTALRVLRRGVVKFNVNPKQVCIQK